MSLLPTRIWLYISFYPPQNQTTDTLRRTGWASMPGPVIIEQNLASGASCESDGRCHRPRAHASNRSDSRARPTTTRFGLEMGVCVSADEALRLSNLAGRSTSDL